MKTGICLFWIALGAIFTFAVTTNTSVFNFHIAGFVVMVIGIIGLVTPKRGYEWLGRRVYVRRTRKYPGGRVDERSYPPYVLRNMGDAKARAGLPDVPSLQPDPEVAKWTEHSQTPEQEMVTGAAPAHDAGEETPAREPIPGDTEVIEDSYEE